MKKVFLTLAAILCIICSYGQDCIIKMRESRDSYAAPIYGKGIKFILVLKDTSLASDGSGDLKISIKFFKKMQNEEVIKISFYNPLDMEFYREPLFSRTKRTLAEYCGQVLVAAPRR